MHKRWLLGGVSGFFFGLALSVILLGLHVVKLDSAVLTILPVAGLVLGFVGALWGPRAPRRRVATPVGAPPDVSAFNTPIANVPPPPPGTPTPPPAQPPVIGREQPPTDPGATTELPNDPPPTQG